MSSDTNIENLLGYKQAKILKEFKDSKEKRIINQVLLFIAKLKESLGTSYGPDFLATGYSNDSIDEFVKVVNAFEFEELKLMLDIHGLDSPDDWLGFAKFLVKTQTGKTEICQKFLERLARAIAFKASGYHTDKDFVRTFFKVPIRRLLKFFEKYRVTAKKETN